MLTTVDLVFAALAAFATIGGFIFEWRRSNRRDEDHASLAERVDGMETRLATIEAWRDRCGRSW